MTSILRSALSPLVPMLLTSIYVTLFFMASTWIPLYLWAPLTCVPNNSGSCDYDPIVALLGVLVAVLVHAMLVAVFAWTPLSAPIRTSPSPVRVSPSDTSKASIFNVFLYASMSADIIAYCLALTAVQGFTGFLQALTISFNAPFLLFIPYALAAYRDPSTDLGAFLHRIRARLLASHLPDCPAQQGSYECDCQLGFDSSENLYTRLESAALVLPRDRSRQSLEHLDLHGEDRGNQEKEKMLPFPRFALFVTAPAGDEDHLP